MSRRSTRRELLGSAGAALFLTPASKAADAASQEIRITTLSPQTARITVLPIQDGRPADIFHDNALVETGWPQPGAKLRSPLRAQTVRSGELRVQIAPDPLAFTIQNAKGETIQQIKIDPATGIVSWATGNAPLLALGEGGPQFDRRGDNDRMRSGQGGYQLRTHGGRVPIQWLIGTSGWGLYIHQPLGTFDLTGPESKFQPPAPNGPLDLFFVSSKEPAVLMAEYARITGRPELPPLWTLGYQQSHRTLASREEILNEAKTFREKKLPCDAMIYLGTGFTPSGWNKGHGIFEFNEKVFPDPKAMIDQLHADHFKVVLHLTIGMRADIRGRGMSGSVKDACDAARPIEEQPSCYWKMHQPIYSLGIDGWWPDEGDPFDAPSRLARNRMYWEAPQLDRPNERPYALHRNGYAGMQRYAAYLWSGDVYSTWETLKTHIPVAVNTCLSGIPLWGTDIAGFVPTKDLTGEYYVRWFQFASFCPLFRAHGRTWKLRLPWGWNTGETGPIETPNVIPEPAELRNEKVEPICRKYLNLRYQMMPYLYSAVRENTQTAMPIIRALWLHYPDDPMAVSRGDEYLWGRDILVAPVVEKGATSRSLYLPRGTWYDFWTSEELEGGKEITRNVDLETTPLYVRAGAIIPMGPVKQYTDEKVDGPLTLTVYPGANGSFLLYDDDGRSFDYRRGEWMGIQMAWNDARRTLSLRLAPGSKLREKRNLEIKMGSATKAAVFEGRPLEVKL